MNQEELRKAAELRRKVGTRCQVTGETGWVDYHGTRIVEFDSDTITLCAGGWKSATTKRRMNQASESFGLGYRVYQEDYRWWVEYRGDTYVFDRDTFYLRRQ